jgi:hypothetical protein
MEHNIFHLSPAKSAEAFSAMIKKLFTRNIQFFGFQFEDKKKEIGILRNNFRLFPDSSDESYLYKVLSILSRVEMIEFVYVAVDQKGGYPVFHFLLAKRDLLGLHIKKGLEEFLSKEVFSEDIVVFPLLDYNAVDVYYRNVLSSCTLYKLMPYSEFYAGAYEEYFRELTDSLGLSQGKQAFLYTPNLCDKVVGTEGKKNVDLVILLWDFFFRERSLFISGSKLYQQQAEYGYKDLDLPVEDLNPEFFTAVVESSLNVFTKKYPQHCSDGVNQLAELSTLYQKEAFPRFLRGLQKLPTKKVFEELVQFKDGIYSFRFNRMVFFEDYPEEFAKFKGQIACGTFFPDIEYRSLKEPTRWIEYMEKKLEGQTVGKFSDADLVKFHIINYATALHKGFSLGNLNSDIEVQRVYIDKNKYPKFKESEEAGQKEILEKVEMFGNKTNVHFEVEQVMPSFSFLRKSLENVEQYGEIADREFAELITYFAWAYFKVYPEKVVFTADKVRYFVETLNIESGYVK